MKQINVTLLMCLGVAAFAQQVQFDYDRSANFSAYKTYQWVDYQRVAVGDQLLDQDIKRAVDEQLAGKGLRRVESGGDLLVGYQTRISEEKQFDAFGSGFGGWGGWGGPGWGNLADIHGTTSTVENGTLTVGLFDPAKKQLVWRGSASKTLDIKKDPDKNYRNLEQGHGQAVQELSARRGQTLRAPIVRFEERMEEYVRCLRQLSLVGSGTSRLLRGVAILRLARRKACRPPGDDSNAFRLASTLMCTG